MTAPVVPDGSAEVDRARAALAAVHERIAAGKKVTPGELAEAQGALSLAELQAEAAVQWEADRVEKERVDKIAKVRDALVSGDLPHQAATITALHDRAVVALRELYEAAVTYQASYEGYLRDLRGLDPLPHDFRVTRAAIVVEGFRWENLETPGDLLVEAAARAHDEATPRNQTNGAAFELILKAAHTGRNGKGLPHYMTDQLRAVAAIADPER